MPPVEETDSAIGDLARLGIPVQSLIVNQVIQPHVVEGNRFLAACAGLQLRYLAEIESRFAERLRTHLPLLDHDVSDLDSLRKLGRISHGE